jgi:hypothetical protein
MGWAAGFWSWIDEVWDVVGSVGSDLLDDFLVF